jgi:acetylornithine deacetylase/succinyl-diaminopimelate desuccinylase-like protein
LSESSRRRRFEHVRRSAREALPSIVDTTIRIAETAAPTGDESRRAELVRNMLAERGYAADIDNVGNVYARRGSHGGPAILLAAHTDTVFPRDTDVRVQREEDTLRGAGVGDNSLGVAAMLGLLDLFDASGITMQSDMIAVANVGEEGLGNLRGIRAAVERYRDVLGAVIAIEGHNLGRVTHAAVGSKRWRITVNGPGGHSWGAFGQPSAIHGLSRIVAAIAALSVPEHPKTTFNIGMIDGGVSINTIAPTASALVDMRSIDPGSLDELSERVGTIARTAGGDGLTTSIEVLGERPAGQTPREHPLAQAAGDAVRAIGIDPIYDASSTDANIPISLGIPSVCVGITRGGQGHTVAEWVQIAPIADGVAQLAWLCLAADEWLAARPS